MKHLGMNHECPICHVTLKGSMSYSRHLLFYHEKYIEPCRRTATKAMMRARVRAKGRKQDPMNAYEKVINIVIHQRKNPRWAMTSYI